ncbi:MAG: TPM domain-containing protein [Marinovum sp.]|nr:TPM domain-containing protein [Marinovum sp.]
MLKRLVSFIVILWAGAALAQSYPDYSSTTVNDFAKVLSTEERQALSNQLKKLRQDTGVEMTVVTLVSKRHYTGATSPSVSLERFATGLFNHWGVGDATRNDGVMLLLLTKDREVRIELGAAYKREWDSTAARVIDNHMIDAFAERKWAQGLQAGTDETIETIVLPFTNGEAPSNDGWIFGIIAAGALVLFGFSLREKISARMRRCPQCGQRKLGHVRETDMRATRSSPGRGRHVVTCTNCAFREERAFDIPRKSSNNNSSSNFGGGSSGGGGASGRF